MIKLIWRRPDLDLGGRVADVGPAISEPEGRAGPLGSQHLLPEQTPRDVLPARCKEFWAWT
jgi:hypothetical protein